MSKKKNVINMAPCAGGSLRNNLREMREQQVDKKGRAAVALLLNVITKPFRMYEGAAYAKQTKEYQFERPPLFILGHWRSGTTFLHNILSQDPQMGYVTTYHSVFSELILGSAGKWLFKGFMRTFMPSQRPGDNVKLNANFPQEEEFAFGNSSPHSYYNFFFYPNNTLDYYERYIAFNNQPESLIKEWEAEYIRLAKRAMLNTGGQRFISKNPPHTGRIPQLLSMFPEARFIHIYRNPIKVFLSTKKFFSTITPLITLQKFSPEVLEDFIIEVYKRMMKKYLADRALIPAKNLVDLRFESLDKGTDKEIERIYSQLELGDYEVVRKQVEAYIDSKKHYKKNKHKISKRELDRVLSEWDFAMKHWGYEVPDDLEIT